MALETLASIDQINGVPISRASEGSEPVGFINVDDKNNTITFKIQDGPIGEVGENGCQVDELVSTALLIVKGLNQKFPSDHNAKAMTSLYEAYAWMQQRKIERTHRGVEGLNKV